MSKMLRNIIKKNKEVLKDAQEVKVDLRNKVYTKDKSRYFKTAWEEERRQLYFK